MTPDQARQLVRAELLRIVPDAAIDVIPADADLREELELDSLDFQSFVAQLSERTGHRIDEDDYGHLRTLAGCVEFLATRD